jgi:protein-S-isoprenylcysteine O-methyltransferase Ste14
MKEEIEKRKKKMGKENRLKEWITPLTVGHFLLMLNIGLNIFIKSEVIYTRYEKIGIAFMVPALILWIIPVMTLRSYGNISSQGSFLATTELVDKGIYRLIRHPQYLGFMILSIGMAFYFQLDMTIVISALTIIFLAFGIKEEEKLLVDQFGDEYQEYKKRVPSINVFLRLFRIVFNLPKYLKK